MGKYKRIVLILSPLICFLLIWGVSLAKCEILTLMHGDEFAEAYQENTMIGEVGYWKVLDYSQTQARVYYIEADRAHADVLTFNKENGNWVETGWDTIWSVSGNAEGIIWPYWWHFIHSLTRL